MKNSESLTILTPEGRNLAVQRIGLLTGNRTVVFLLHPAWAAGGPTPSAEEMTRRGIELVTFDRPGYGDSTRKPGLTSMDVAEDIRLIADRLGHEKFHIFSRGNSAAYAFAFASRNAERVLSITTMSSSIPRSFKSLDYLIGLGETNVELHSLPTQRAIEAIKYRVQKTSEDPEWLLKFLDPDLTDEDRRILNDPIFRDELVRSHHRTVKQGPDGVIDDYLATFSENGWGIDLTQIQTPVVVWHGRNDPFASITSAKTLERLLPNAQLRLDANASHLSHYEALSKLLDEMTTQKTPNTADALHDQLVETLRPLVQGKNVAILDFPNYANCGDSAIWVGTELVLQKLGAKVLYRADSKAYNPDHVAALPSDTVILLQGGGSFGDLYPKRQALRERVIEKFPDREVVVLPQSIKFNNRDALERAKSIFDRHSKLTLLLRDRASLKFAQENFRAKSMLCPDAAFGLKLQRTTNSSQDVFAIARSNEDKEGTHDRLFPVAQQRNLSPIDWFVFPKDDPMFPQRQLATRVAASTPSVYGQKFESIQKRVGSLYWQLANGEIKRAADLLSKGRTVVTDRLHGHILSEIMEIPHVAVDSGYGKIKEFHKEWLTNSELAHLETSPEKACEKAQQLSISAAANETSNNSIGLSLAS